MPTCHVCETLIEHIDTIWAEGDTPFCQNCADDELEECDYCGDLRYPENLFTYDGKNGKYTNDRMCVGCIEQADDELSEYVV